jgi:RNA polymerase sigma-70 factor (ECF subfamily)
MRPYRLEKAPDEVLLQQLRNGASDALVVLFERYCRQVFSVADRILRNGTEAEEVMQEVFLELHRDAANLDAAGVSVKTWIVQRANQRSLERWQYITADAHSDEREVA